MSVLHILFVDQHATILILQSALSHVLLMDVNVQKEQLWISSNVNVCLKMNVKVHNKSLHICRVSLNIIDYAMHNISNTYIHVIKVRKYMKTFFHR